jgi:hypothetical protein
MIGNFVTNLIIIRCLQQRDMTSSAEPVSLLQEIHCNRRNYGCLSIMSFPLNISCRTQINLIIVSPKIFI